MCKYLFKRYLKFKKEEQNKINKFFMTIKMNKKRRIMSTNYVI